MREITVRKVEKKQMISKEVRKRLKELGLYSRVRFMVKEVIFCPKEQREFSPMNCMVCPHYLRRVKGRIHCNYK